MNYLQIIEEHLANDIPHSEEYREGMIDGFRWMYERTPINCSYKSGSVQCDAFFFGRLKGMELYERERRKMGSW